MDKKILSTTREWLKKALSDLGSAEILGWAPDAHLDTALYHCQQTAEKAVKAYLFFRAAPLQKTHDVGDLVQQAAQLEPAFSVLMADADLLTPFAIAYRYPDHSGFFVEPVETEFSAALAAARRVYEFVLSQLPPETQPL